MESKVLKLAMICLFGLSAVAGQAQSIANLLKTRDSLHMRYEAMQDGKKTIWGNIPKKSLQEQLSTLEAITVTDSAIIKALWLANKDLSQKSPAKLVVNQQTAPTDYVSGELENNRTAAALAHYTLLANKRELKLLQTETHYQEKLSFFQNFTAIVTIIAVVSLAFHFLQLRKYFGSV